MPTFKLHVAPKAGNPALPLSRKALPVLLLDSSGEALSLWKADCLGSALGGLGS